MQGVTQRALPGLTFHARRESVHLREQATAEIRSTDPGDLQVLDEDVITWRSPTWVLRRTTATWGVIHPPDLHLVLGAAVQGDPPLPKHGMRGVQPQPRQHEREDDLARRCQVNRGRSSCGARSQAGDRLVLSAELALTGQATSSPSSRRKVFDPKTGPLAPLGGRQTDLRDGFVYLPAELRGQVAGVRPRWAQPSNITSR